MESLYLLIPLSIVFAFIIGISFWWSVKSGQFDDLEGPAYRILMDDDSITSDENKTSKETTLSNQSDKPKIES